MDLMSRKKVTLVYAKRYRRASSKKEKSQILDEFVRLTGYNRYFKNKLYSLATPVKGVKYEI